MRGEQALSAKHWRKRADEARSLAARQRSDYYKRSWLTVSENYERLARHAESRERHVEERQMNRKTDAATLLEQARRLRELSHRFDHPIIKDDVLRMAEQCEVLAQTANDAVVHYETTASAAGASSRRAPQPGTIEEVSEPTHESLKNVHAYWLAKRGSRMAPPRSTIWLEDVARLTPNIALIDVVGDPPRFRFHLCGTRLAEAYGENVTGKYLDEMDLGSISFPTLNLYTNIVRGCRVQVVRARFNKRRDGRNVDYERIGLPLSEDGKAVTMILCAYAYHEECFNAASGDVLRRPA